MKPKATDNPCLNPAWMKEYNLTDTQTLARLAKIEFLISNNCHSNVDRAVDQLSKAKRELAKGNRFGANYFLAAAEDAFFWPNMGSYVPGETTKLMNDAAVGKSVGNAHESRDDFADKQDFIRLVRELNSVLPSPPYTLKGWVNLKELTPYKNKYTGRDTLRGWINEAIPGTLKTGRPRKDTVIG